MRRMRGLVDGLRFAEGIRWHGNALWFSDMLDKRVYRCTMAGRPDVVIDGGRTLVLAETYGSRLLSYDRSDDGSLSNRRAIATFGELQPDGMALDAEGCAWVALSEYFGRVDLRSGAVVDRIALPGLMAI